MKLFLAAILLCATSLFAQVSKEDVAYVNTVFYPATALLYSQDDSGEMQMHCTATAIEKNKTGYLFLTAAHCGSVDDLSKNTVSPEQTFFFISPDENGSKSFLKAVPVGAGFRHKGDDFMLFQVDTDKSFPVIPLGKDAVAMEQVVNVASPLGLGKQIFIGTVSAASLDRPVIEDDINWTGATLVELFGVDGGSSGSAMVCLDQKAICALIVGSIGGTTMVSVPVSRLIKFREELNAGTYKYWQPDVYAAPKPGEPAHKH